VWISHRGLKNEAVENTLEAFRAAVACGFSALETDLRLSRDGHIVLHHDPNLKRLAHLNLRVSDLDRSELEKILLRSGKVTGRILFLDQFIREFPACNWTFDIKPEQGMRTIEGLHDWSRRVGVFDWLAAQSKFVVWTEEQERRLLSLFPRSSIYAQEMECWRAGLWTLMRFPVLGRIRPGRTYSIPPRVGPFGLYKHEIVEVFHRAGAQVLAFLPETAAQAEQAMAAGVDEILTNGVIITEKRDVVGDTA
jgi:glycerophosphoryl diester phosphodiesterase